ncbi:MAG: sel1 repeat family protein [Clostridiales bacterium]|nr:sel1 repeat family protein [Clostridiales bacterium]
MSKKARTYEYFDEEIHSRIMELLKGDWGNETFLQMKAYAEQGNAEAQYYLGLMYDDGKGVERNPTQAAQWYEKAAKQGIAAAQSNLGAMYETGDGVKTDLALAKKWYSLAAGQGYEDARRRLDELRT